MSRGVIVLLVVVGIIVVGLGIAFLFGINGMKKTLSLQIKNVDLSSVADGTYRGNYEGGRFSCAVDVKVADHKITGVTVVKDQVGAASSPIRGQLIDKIIASQSLTVKVDAITGGTATTNGYLGAIENALKGAGAR